MKKTSSAAKKAMLTEPMVVRAVMRYLKKRGYFDFKTTSGRAHGDDLIGRPPRGRFTLHIEAKGQTGAHKGSRRYGKPFSAAQIRDHMATATYKAICMRGLSTAKSPRRVALALPDIPSKRNCFEHVKPALRELRIGVFWASPTKVVTFEGSRAP
jgi:hypothetical protein